MTLEQCAARMTALLARKPRKAVTRKLLATLPKRAPIVVSPCEYKVFGKPDRYADWVARGCPPSPSLPPRRKDRLRPSQRTDEYATAIIEIARHQMGLCSLCRRPLEMEVLYERDDNMRPTFDHVRPRSRGGANIGNRLVAHRICNGRKGNNMPTGCELIWLAAVNCRLTTAAETE